GPGDLDDVPPVRPVDHDSVRCAVAVAVEAGEVDGDVFDVGAGEVVDGDGVGAAEGADVDGFDAAGVHGDACDVAGESGAGGVGGGVDRFWGVGAGGGGGGVAALAFDGVAAVAGVPLEVVVAGSELGGVGSDVAVEVVVAGAAEE